MRLAQFLRPLLGIVVALVAVVAAVVSFTFLAASLQPVGPDRFVWFALGLGGALSFLACAWGLWRIRQLAVWKLALVPLISACLLLPGYLLLAAFGKHPP